MLRERTWEIAGGAAAAGAAIPLAGLSAVIASEKVVPLGTSSACIFLNLCREKVVTAGASVVVQ